jgi:hypothetical protein
VCNRHGNLLFAISSDVVAPNSSATFIFSPFTLLVLVIVLVIGPPVHVWRACLCVGESQKSIKVFILFRQGQQKVRTSCLRALPVLLSLQISHPSSPVDSWRLPCGSVPPIPVFLGAGVNSASLGTGTPVPASVTMMCCAGTGTCP